MEMFQKGDQEGKSKGKSVTSGALGEPVEGAGEGAWDLGRLVGGGREQACSGVEGSLKCEWEHGGRRGLQGKGEEDRVQPEVSVTPWLISKVIEHKVG